MSTKKELIAHLRAIAPSLHAVYHIIKPRTQSDFLVTVNITAGSDENPLAITHHQIARYLRSINSARLQKKSVKGLTDLAERCSKIIFHVEQITGFSLDCPMLLEYKEAAEHFSRQSAGLPLDVVEINRLSEHRVALLNYYANEFNELLGSSACVIDDEQKYIFDKQLIIEYLNNSGFEIDENTQIQKIMSDYFPHDGQIYRNWRSIGDLSSTALLHLMSAGESVKPGFQLFAQSTGRTSPIVTEGHILGMGKEFRPLIKVPAGKTLVIADYVAQETYISAHLSGDALYLADYLAEDMYIAVGKRLGVVPGTATKASHPAERKMLKRLVLGVGYDQGRKSLCKSYGEEMGGVFDLFHSTYQTRCEWAAKVRQQQFHRAPDGWIVGEMQHRNGYRLVAKITQAHGAAMLRQCVRQLYATAPQLDLVYTHHDSLAVLCDEGDAETVKDTLRAVMQTASTATMQAAEPCKIDFETVCGGECYPPADDIIAARIAARSSLLERFAKGEQPAPAPSAVVQLFPPSAVLSVQGRYVSDGVTDADLTRALSSKFVCIRGEKGSGKTVLARRISEHLSNQKSKHVCMQDGKAAKMQRGLALTHRVSLVYDLAETLGFDNYKDPTNGSGKPGFAVCINSISKAFADGQKYDYIIIDEIVQFVRNILAETLHGKRRAIFAHLRKAVREAKNVILIDADFSAVVFRFFEFLLSAQSDADALAQQEYLRSLGFEAADETEHTSSRYLISHDVPAHQRITYNMHVTAGSLIDSLNTAILQGRRVYFCCNERAQVEYLTQYIQSQYPAKRVLAITSQTRTGLSEAEWLTNPTVHSMRYDIVLASPSVATGVSIEQMPRQAWRKLAELEQQHSQSEAEQRYKFSRAEIAEVMQYRAGTPGDVPQPVFDAVYSLTTDAAVQTFHDKFQAEHRVRGCQSVHACVADAPGSLVAGDVSYAGWLESNATAVRHALPDAADQTIDNAIRSCLLLAHAEHQRNLCGRSQKYLRMAWNKGHRIVQMPVIDPELEDVWSAVLNQSRDDAQALRAKKILQADALGSDHPAVVRAKEGRHPAYGTPQYWAVHRELCADWCRQPLTPAICAEYVRQGLDLAHLLESLRNPTHARQQALEDLRTIVAGDAIGVASTAQIVKIDLALTLLQAVAGLVGRDALVKAINRACSYNHADYTDAKLSALVADGAAVAVDLAQITDAVRAVLVREESNLAVVCGRRPQGVPVAEKSDRELLQSFNLACRSLLGCWIDSASTRVGSGVNRQRVYSYALRLDQLHSRALQQLTHLLATD